MKDNAFALPLRLVRSFVASFTFSMNRQSDLHPRDNQKLLETLCALRDLGNTVLVVEHDEETIRRADYVVDLGPGAGAHGGEMVANGTAENVANNPNSITGLYLRGKNKIEVPTATAYPKRQESRHPRRSR